MKRFQFFTLALLVSMTMPAVAEPLAYVPNEKSATISVIDTEARFQPASGRAGSLLERTIST